uniref:Polynucleotide adenylyltransferase n=1 Tax=Palpitomonas bilix TaxID=652834 RepID=A0A7S3DCU6_9EUKA|mmetsp:Transcript_31826/g.83084  ORF Transcript_31826/g.83084 Transcript_31826/m.83084 type:complete len:630 (+) Transcript_31826:57-1946(+)
MSALPITSWSDEEGDSEEEVFEPEEEHGLDEEETETRTEKQSENSSSVDAQSECKDDKGGDENVSISLEGEKSIFGEIVEQPKTRFAADLRERVKAIKLKKDKAPSEGGLGDIVELMDDDVTRKRRRESRGEERQSKQTTCASASKASDGAAGVEATMFPPSWARGSTKHMDLCDRLHEEILEFSHYHSLTRDEKEFRNAAVERLTKVAKSIWPDSDTMVFGSYSTGLSLPTSDVDVVVFVKGYEKERARRDEIEKKYGSQADEINKLASVHLLRALEKTIRQCELAKTIISIEKARVPILKIVDAKTSISLDICFNNPSGIDNSKYIAKTLKEKPELVPIILILKSFLQQRELHETFKGGIGSYLLTLMTLSHIQLHPMYRKRDSFKTLPEVNLGCLLMDFFQVYGKGFNYGDLGVVVEGRGKLIDKTLRDDYEEKRANGLCVVDPVAGADIGKGAWNIGIIRQAFEHAFFRLSGIVMKKGGVASTKYLLPLILSAERERDFRDSIGVVGDLLPARERESHSRNEKHAKRSSKHTKGHSHGSHPSSKTTASAGEARHGKRGSSSLKHKSKSNSGVGGVKKVIEKSSKKKHHHSHSTSSGEKSSRSHHSRSSHHPKGEQRRIVIQRQRN